MKDSWSSPVLLLAGLVSELASPTDISPMMWEELVPAASHHRLGPMLCHILLQADVLDRLRRADATILQAEYHQARARNLVALAAAQEWSRRFDKAGILAVWIKGVPLSLTVFPQPGLRPMTDIDLLLQPEQAIEAVSLMEDVTGQKTVGLSSRLDKHAVINVGIARSVRMEAHWNLVDLPHQQVIEDVSWFLEERCSLPGEDAFYGLRPAAHLLYLCAHAEIVHGETDFLLLRYLDLHRLILASPDLNWALLLDRAVDFGWTYAVERALVIAQRFFATPVPDGLLAELRLRRPAYEDTNRVTRHQIAGERGQKLLNRFAGLSWPARLRLAAGLAFPSPTYMRHRYALNAGWKVPLYYPYRWLDTATQVGKALGEDVSARITARTNKR